MIAREQYIFHPRQIPIHLEATGSLFGGDQQQPGYGGLRCRWRDGIAIGCLLRISIPALDPLFFASGQVSWRRLQVDDYELGLVFLDPQQAYRMRLMEQICHIRCYRRWVLEQEGRQLDSQQAAQEWIHRYAGRFPTIMA